MTEGVKTIMYPVTDLANAKTLYGELLERIAVMLATCLALLTYHVKVALSLFISIRVRLLMDPLPQPVQYQRNAL